MNNVVIYDCGIATVKFNFNTNVCIPNEMGSNKPYDYEISVHYVEPNKNIKGELNKEIYTYIVQWAKKACCSEKDREKLINKTADNFMNFTHNSLFNEYMNKVVSTKEYNFNRVYDSFVFFNSDLSDMMCFIGPYVKYMFESGDYRSLTSLVMYTICRIKNCGILHCSSIMKNGKAYIFSGPSGCGKSTVFNKLYDVSDELLNDELVLVKIDDKTKKVFCAATPISCSPSWPRITEKWYPISDIFMLKHDSYMHIDDISVGEKISKIYHEMYDRAYMVISSNNNMMYEFDLSCHIASTCNVHMLSFALDSDLTEII